MLQRERLRIPGRSDSTRTSTTPSLPSQYSYTAASMELIACISAVAEMYNCVSVTLVAQIQTREK